MGRVQYGASRSSSCLGECVLSSTDGAWHGDMKRSIGSEGMGAHQLLVFLALLMTGSTERGVTQRAPAATGARVDAGTRRTPAAAAHAS
jgi:hypothetical protein